jgi:hypothetical protein
LAKHQKKMEKKKVVAQIIQQGIDNWKLGKDTENEVRLKLLAEGQFSKASTLKHEWKHVNWFREDGWNDDIKRELISLGFKILSDRPDDLNVLIECPPKKIISK